MVPVTRSLTSFLTNLFRHQFMIRNLIARDLKGRYAGSYLGGLWTFIHPLIQIAIYFFVFSVILGIRSQHTGVAFAPWLVMGLLPWFFLTDVISRSPDTVVSQANLITNMVFPSEILILVNLGSAIIHHLISLGLFLIVLFLFDISVSISPGFLLLLLLSTSLLLTGLGWFLSAVTVFIRDIGNLLNLVLPIWFFITPIIYPIQRVPDRFITIYKLNPAVYLVEGYRQAVFDIHTLGLHEYAAYMVASVIIFLLGAWIFKQSKPHFADIL